MSSICHVAFVVFARPVGERVRTAIDAEAAAAADLVAREIAAVAAQCNEAAQQSQHQLMQRVELASAQQHEQFVIEARVISAAESARAVASVSEAVEAIDGRVFGAESRMREIGDALNSQQMVSAALGELVASFQVCWGCMCMGVWVCVWVLGVAWVCNWSFWCATVSFSCPFVAGRWQIPHSR